MSALIPLHSTANIDIEHIPSTELYRNFHHPYSEFNPVNPQDSLPFTNAFPSFPTVFSLNYDQKYECFSSSPLIQQELLQPPFHQQPSNEAQQYHLHEHTYYNYSLSPQTNAYPHYLQNQYQQHTSTIQQPSSHPIGFSDHDDDQHSSLLRNSHLLGEEEERQGYRLEVIKQEEEEEEDDEDESDYLQNMTGHQFELKRTLSTTDLEQLQKPEQFSSSPRRTAASTFLSHPCGDALSVVLPQRVVNDISSQYDLLKSTSSSQSLATTQGVEKFSSVSPPSTASTNFQPQSQQQHQLTIKMKRIMKREKAKSRRKYTLDLNTASNGNTHYLHSSDNFAEPISSSSSNNDCQRNITRRWSIAGTTNCKESFTPNNILLLQKLPPSNPIKVKEEASSQTISSIHISRGRSQSEVIARGNRSTLTLSYLTELEKKLASGNITVEELYQLNAGSVLKSSELSINSTSSGIAQLDVRQQKKIMQMIRNRISAQNSRDRKKAYISKLEQDSLLTRDEIQQQLFQVEEELQTEKDRVKVLEEQLKQLQECAASSQEQRVDKSSQNISLKNNDQQSPLKFLGLVKFLKRKTSSNIASSQIPQNLKIQEEDQGNSSLMDCNYNQLEGGLSLKNTSISLKSSTFCPQTKTQVSPGQWMCVTIPNRGGVENQSTKVLAQIKTVKAINKIEQSSIQQTVLIPIESVQQPLREHSRTM